MQGDVEANGASNPVHTETHTGTCDVRESWIVESDLGMD